MMKSSFGKRLEGHVFICQHLEASSYYHLILKSQLSAISSFKMGS